MNNIINEQKLRKWLKKYQVPEKEIEEFIKDLINDIEEEVDEVIEDNKGFDNDNDFEFWD